MGSQRVIGLTKRQREILAGLLLGDGCLELNGKHVRLKIDHSEKQKEYVFWLFNEFFNLVNSKPYFLRALDKRSGKVSNHWRFSTKSVEVFDSWWKKFYVNGKKIIPFDLKSLVKSPLSLAVWYMDDGFRRKDCKGAYFCTSAYTVSEHKILQDVFSKNFGFETRIHFAAKHPRIYIPSRFIEKFSLTIKPFVIPSLQYKLF